jgi:uncharacterized protein
MKTKFLLFFFCVLSFTAITGSLPSKPTSFKGISDFAVLLTETEFAKLNGIFASLNYSNNFEIVCLIVPDLNSYKIEEYGQKIFKKWEIGGTKNDNGILILIKTKTSNVKGEIYITVSNNLREYFPDMILQNIINNEFIKNLKNNDYFKAIFDGTIIINEIAKDKSTFEAKTIIKKSNIDREESSTTIIIIGIISLIIILVIFVAGFQNRFGSMTNVLIIGVVYIILGIVALILRFDITNALFDFGERLLDSLINQGNVKTTYNFILINSIVLIIAGIILAIKSILFIIKDLKYNSNKYNTK